MYLRARLGISYLPQEPSIFRNLTVEENLVAILELRGLSRERDHVERAASWRSSGSSTWPARPPTSSRGASGGAPRSPGRS